MPLPVGIVFKTDRMCLLASFSILGNDLISTIDICVVNCIFYCDYSIGSISRPRRVSLYMSRWRLISHLESGKDVY